MKHLLMAARYDIGQQMGRGENGASDEAYAQQREMTAFI